MIKTKKELNYYMNCDRIALGITRRHPSLVPSSDLIWKFERLLRKTEFYSYRSGGGLLKIYYLSLKIKFSRLSRKLGFSIPLNVFGPGLSIAHYGTIVVNWSAKIGKNCRLQECTNIGSTNGSAKAPSIGDNCFIGTGAKIIGNIRIGNNVCIGAGAVVVKDVPDNVTVGGVPARVISNNNSHNNLQKSLFDNGLL